MAELTQQIKKFFKVGKEAFCFKGILSASKDVPWLSSENFDMHLFLLFLLRPNSGITNKCSQSRYALYLTNLRAMSPI